MAIPVAFSERIDALLAEFHVLSLAACDGTSHWAAPLFYVFDPQNARLVLEAHWLDVCLPNHHSLALRQAVKLLELEGAQVHQKLDLIQAVERAISRDLTRGSHLEKIAGDLNMSGRTLRRRLTEHALTFEALLEQVRQARTMSLLANPDMSIERITEEVGYSDVRSFRRAFKRWTGQSPSAYRGEAQIPAH